ncbi:Amino acid ABC transporte (plasmid) [Cupriavidus taiwanensis]|uniref:Amino acid ABC transporte n=1 Tax=Cupriavidus taiwanensis TaxID=164546 RepID=A0A375HEX0_9BURK|nr:ectoine/hydroxyectoine ABC transporter substrate-binding protein EhuB [Cupriavidus taiwanensis]SOZ70943.1 Amino acid ABC transporte [Cupriavidus taiwanensis]SOZ72132.1 Amino acid ABC transporte [Cupriavidus taiwanensis]SOZ74429.1 Amino acid ABC transporte [Cupriavidus taiwanensis]SPA03334.1 Amino acid ABC transporte [Cupriavidus taiwanensis]SPA11309.1 Amino acid ABC transporte [Cupriavidus taiwanensis]
MVSFSKMFIYIAVAIGMTASTAATAQQTKERVLRESSIKIGITNNSPWSFINPDGSVSGVHPDLIRAVLRPLGIKSFEFVNMEFGALIPSVLAKKVDVVAAGMGITAPRCKQVIFSNPDLASVDGMLVLKGNPLKIHSYEDVIGNSAIRMGGGRGSSNTENAVGAGIPRERMQLFQSVDSGVAALVAGRIDAITFGAATVDTLLKQPALKDRIERAVPFKGRILKNGRESANYGAMVFRPEDADLRDAYNASFAKLKADGTVKSILAKYGFLEAPEGLTVKELCSPDYYK